RVVLDHAVDFAFGLGIAHERGWKRFERRRDAVVERLVVQRVEGPARGEQQRHRGAQLERGPRGPFHAQPSERGREIGNRLRIPSRLTADHGAHRLHARVLAGDLPFGKERLELPGSRCAGCARRVPRDEVQHAGELEHGERVPSGIHAGEPPVPNSSRAIRLIVLPSARPLYWGTTLLITAPMLAAPPLMAVRTASRISSSLTDAGGYTSRTRISSRSCAASSERPPFSKASSDSRRRLMAFRSTSITSASVMSRWSAVW